MEQEPNSAPDPTHRDSSIEAWLSHKRIRIIWIGIYFVLSFMCFLVFVPIVMMKNDSDGKCLLYADTLGFGQDSVCNYSIAISVIFLITCTLRAVYMILELTRYASKLPSTKFLKNTVVKSIILLVDMIILLLLLVAASTISAGFLSLCDSLFVHQSDCDSPNGIGLFPSGKVNDTFHTQLSIAQDSAWVTFCLWLVLVIIKFVIFWKEGSLKESTAKAKSLFGKKNPDPVWTTKDAPHI